MQYANSFSCLTAYPGAYGSDSSAPSDSACEPWRFVGGSLAYFPLAFSSLKQSPVFPMSDSNTIAEVARASWPRPLFVAPQDRHRVSRLTYATFCRIAPVFCIGLYSRKMRLQA